MSDTERLPIIISYSKAKTIMKRRIENHIVGFKDPKTERSVTLVDFRRQSYRISRKFAERLKHDLELSEDDTEDTFFYFW